MFNGRITRVRMDAEGSEVTDVDRAIDEGFGVIFHALAQAIEAGALRSDEGPLVFPRETRFGENIIESKIRDSGAIYHVGRRVVHFELPDHPDLGSSLVPADLVIGLLDALDGNDRTEAASQRAYLRALVGA